MTLSREFQQSDGEVLTGTGLRENRKREAIIDYGQLWRILTTVRSKEVGCGSWW